MEISEYEALFNKNYLVFIKTTTAESWFASI